MMKLFIVLLFILLTLTKASGESKKPTKNEFHLREERPKYAIELMIAADYTMVAFYGDKLNDYLEEFANILNGIFQNPTLETPMEVKLVKKVIFHEDVFHAETMLQLVDNFTAWNEKQNNHPNDDCSPEEYDHALLLTKNGCKGGCGREGASSSGLCTFKSTCVTKDRGLMSTLMAAHEIGYSFGLRFDGFGDGCEGGQYIMSKVQVTKGDKLDDWSKCSSDALAKILRSPRASCFKNLPRCPPKFTLAGKKYDRNEQCHFTFGPDYGTCSKDESICIMLFCQYKDLAHKCESIFLPVADGTYCGQNQWCMQGKCVPNGNSSNPAPVDGGWSTWSDYGPCSMDCGTGVQWRERTCTNPKASHGGKSCEGENKVNYRTCNTFKCETPADPRSTQCASQEIKTYSYYYNAGEPCSLNCRTDPNSLVYRKFGYVKDGTPCHPNGITNDVCINGKCEKVGCDLVLHSGAVKDRCGVCHGDGTPCQLHTGRNMETFSSRGPHFVVKIPAGASDLMVKELGLNFYSNLGFKVGDSPNFAMSIPRLTPKHGTVYNLDGTEIRFFSIAPKAKDELICSGKIDKPLSIYFNNYIGPYAPDTSSKGIEWHYLGKPNGSPEHPTFKWVGKEWSECSLSCGRGVISREVICTRTDDNSQVNKKSCSHLEELLSHKTCHLQDCPPQWHYTDWTECSKSCGSGTQTRKLICSVITAESMKTVVDEECPKPKPIEPTAQSCNVVMCHAKWHVLSDYGECSARCGDGKKRKDIACEHITKDGKVEKTHPIECYNEARPKGVEYCYEKPC